jgi:ribosomal protection tetracycline resistance protein
VLSGLHDARVGDATSGATAGRPRPPSFAPPTLETAVVRAIRPARAPLHAALAQLADQDPLIDLRQDPARARCSSRSTRGPEGGHRPRHAHDAASTSSPRDDHHLHRRGAGRGAAVERLGDASTLLASSASCWSRPPRSGLDVRLAVDVGACPRSTSTGPCDVLPGRDDRVRGAALRRGRRLGGPRLRGDGDRVRLQLARHHRGRLRKLTPRVLAAALRRTGTVVASPCTASGSTSRRTRSRPSAPAGPAPRRTGRTDDLREWCTVEGDIPAPRSIASAGARRADAGRGVLESWFDRYEPVPAGMPQPSRARPAGPAAGMRGTAR